MMMMMMMMMIIFENIQSCDKFSPTTCMQEYLMAYSYK